MKPWLKWTGGILIAVLYVACSPKQFSLDESACQNTGQQCVVQNNKYYFTHSETVAGGKVDILIVDDNSASMSYEQTNLANRFTNFINNLHTKKIEYRLGIVTTDVTAGTALLPFTGGEAYLTNKSFGEDITQIDAAFKANIKRPETLLCETFIMNYSGDRSSSDYATKYAQNCPNGDERGIVAINSVVAGNPSSFIRPEADLAVIVLADEDEKSGLYCKTWDATADGPWSTPPKRKCSVEKTVGPGVNASDVMSAEDRATSVVSALASKYATKKYSVHSIITKDVNCLTTQNNQTGGLVSGSYGYEYWYLSRLTGGVVGDICATGANYTTQLQNIFNNIMGQILDKVALNCANPPDLTVSLTNNPDPTITWTVVGKEIKFSKKLPEGTTVSIAYSCDSI